MKERIRSKIRFLTKKYNTNDPLVLAQCLNIKVFFVPLGKIAGFYKYMKHNRCIYINSCISDAAFLRVVIAHELGHIERDIITRRLGGLEDEIEADKFAVRLGLTNELRNALQRMIDAKINLEEEDGLKKRICELSKYL